MFENLTINRHDQKVATKSAAKTTLREVCRSAYPKYVLSSYAHNEIIVAFLVVKSFRCLVIASRGGGVATFKFDRIIPLLLPWLPIPTRTRNAGIRP